MKTTKKSKITLWNILDQQSDFWEEEDPTAMVRGVVVLIIICIFMACISGGLK